MSLRRRASLGPSPLLRVEPDGRRVRGCRLCGREVPRGRRYWCGQECVDRYGLMSRPYMLRGPCELCGLDADLLERCMVAAVRSLTRRRWGLRGPAAELAQELLGRTFPSGTSWREVDHRVPLVEGGGLEPENLRPLCVPCHRRETSALARRRADRRRGQASLLDVSGG